MRLNEETLDIDSCACLQTSTWEVEAEDQDFRVYLGSMVNLRPTWATYMKACLSVEWGGF